MPTRILDYTVMRGLLEDLEFFPWIREITARAAALTPEDWLASAMWGAAEALAGGVTTIGDCTFSGAAYHAAKALGLGGNIYQEVFGIDEICTVEEIVTELRARVDFMVQDSGGTRLRIGISPHAPYTVRPALFRALAQYADEANLMSVFMPPSSARRRNCCAPGQALLPICMSGEGSSGSLP